MIVPEVNQDPERLLAHAGWSQHYRGKQTDKEVFGENKPTIARLQTGEYIYLTVSNLNF